MKLFQIQVSRLFRVLIKSLPIFVLGCSMSESTSFDVESICKSMDYENIKTVPLIRLIASPGPYHGKCVATNGYISFGFEGNAIYLSYEDYKNINIDKSALILLPRELDEYYNADFYKDHEGGVIVLVENDTDSDYERTILHLYKTRFQALDIPIVEDLISRGE